MGFSARLATVCSIWRLILLVVVVKWSGLNLLRAGASVRGLNGGITGHL